MSAYLDRLLEIQNSTDHSFFLLDPDTEPRFVINANMRTIEIPKEFQFIGVKTDNRAEKVYFEIDRIFDNVDLSTKTCVVQYINAGNGYSDDGIFPVIDLDVDSDPGKIIFKWEVDNIACGHAGFLSFAIRFYDIDADTRKYTYCWNTVPATIEVLDTLDVKGSVVEKYPTELMEWHYRMMELNKKIEQNIKISATFIPSMAPDGTLSWDNTGGLPNPEPINLKGPKPEVGVDYFTEEDKEAIVADVLSALPALDEVSY